METDEKVFRKHILVVGWELRAVELVEVSGVGREITQKH